MGWARFDDNYSMNPKILAAGPWAELLDMRGIIWCARYETDGLLSFDALPIVGRAIPKVREKAAKLIECGRWDECPEGWLILNYLEYNPSHEECERRRLEGKERAQRSRERAANEQRTNASGSGDPRGGDGLSLSLSKIDNCERCDENGFLGMNEQGEIVRCFHEPPLSLVESDFG